MKNSKIYNMATYKTQKMTKKTHKFENDNWESIIIDMEGSCVLLRSNFQKRKSRGMSLFRRNGEYLRIFNNFLFSESLKYYPKAKSNGENSKGPINSVVRTKVRKKQGQIKGRNTLRENKQKIGS